jgi:hypothetical protein
MTKPHGWCAPHPCATWRQRPSAETGEALAAALDHLNEAVQPHLDDEEQKIVPLAAVTLTQQEWDAMGKRRRSACRKPRHRSAFQTAAHGRRPASVMIMATLDSGPVRWQPFGH